MTQKSDGQNYAPKGKPNPVVKAGEFVFAAAFLDHGHINGQCNGLTEAGATLKWVYDADPHKVEAFLKTFPGTKVAGSFEEILADPEVKLVATAAIPHLRGPIGCKVMQAGKDYFTDKPPFTTLDQLPRRRGSRPPPAGNTWCTTASACTWSPPCSPPILSSRAPLAALSRCSASGRIAKARAGPPGSTKGISSAASCATSARTSSSNS
ncbi:MAG: Gfo/Idh/MocA family oxidoreductase [Lacunisphaera sp.]